MSYPQPPEITTSYSAAEQALGDGTLPGQEMDVDFAAVRASVTEAIEFLKGITRSDGKLANGIVTQESLASSVIAGFDTPVVWSTGQAYTTSSLVFEGPALYICLVEHTSTDFATDLSSARWSLLADLTPAGGGLIASNNLSDLTDAGNARANLGLGSMATAAAGTGAAQFRTNLENDIVFNAAAIPAGGIIMWSGAIVAIPSGWALCDGSAGTPDLRGRFVIGAGGAYAVAATGGQESITQVPAHTHANTLAVASDGAHTHGINDPGHNHDVGRSTVDGTSSLNAKSGSTSGGDYTSGSRTTGISIQSGGAHTHALTGGVSSAGSASVDVRPPYYALCYIMKT